VNREKIFEFACLAVDRKYDYWIPTAIIQRFCHEGTSQLRNAVKIIDKYSGK
jgi:hypothetical protein